MRAKRQASVQNDIEKTRGGVDANFLSTSRDNRNPSAVVGPSGEGTYLTFVGVQVSFPSLAPDHNRVYY